MGALICCVIAKPSLLIWGQCRQHTGTLRANMLWSFKEARLFVCVVCCVCVCVLLSLAPTQPLCHILHILYRTDVHLYIYKSHVDSELIYGKLRQMGRLIHKCNW